ncbi:DUF86 domain-containing protein [Pseudomonas sp. S1(2024)]|uniref:HepT-like ribonuclease domain-containing protein n=1 Tax=Pseudomonas sp. S1(2024) TaxID=3390191 RepID=UPI00397C9604
MSLPKKRELRDCLDEIKQASQDISDFTKDMTYDQFSKNRMSMLATLKAVEVIGQACWELREHHKDFLAEDPDLTNLVNQARGMRNKTAHNYNATDYRMVFGVKDAAPELIAKLENRYQLYKLKTMAENTLPLGSFGKSLKNVLRNNKLDKSDSGPKQG